MMERIVDWFFGWGGPVIGAVVIIALFVGIGFLAVHEQREWATFAAEHDCKLVRKTRGRTITTVGSDGKVHTGSVSGEKCYLCDDGVEYCR